jgi:hypothetical protein
MSGLVVAAVVVSTTGVGACGDDDDICLQCPSETSMAETAATSPGADSDAD